MKDNTNAIGRLIRDYRQAKGLTREQFAEILCISASTITKWEIGENEVSTRYFAEISSILNVPRNLLSACIYISFDDENSYNLAKSANAIDEINLSSSFYQISNEDLQMFSRLNEVNPFVFTQDFFTDNYLLMKFR